MKNILLLLTVILTMIISLNSCSLLPTGTNKPDSIDEPIISRTAYIRDYEYIDRFIFNLDLPIDNLQPTDKVTKLIMYESAPSYNTDDTLPIANFYANPNDTSQYKKESIVGNFTKVKEIPATDYDYYNDADRNLHYVIFNSHRPRSVALGCYMEVTDTLGNVRTFGNLNEIAVIGSDTTQIYSLKLMAREDSYYRPSQITWQLM